MMSANTNNPKKTLTVGIVISAVLTVLYYFASIYTMILESSTLYSHKTLIYILTILRDLFEVSIYGAGAALTLLFVAVGNKKFRNYAYISVLLVLFFDYGISFVFDFAVGTIDGVEAFTLVYLLLNFILRAAFYALTVFIAERIMKTSDRAELTPIPFVSFDHPVSRILGVVFLVRIAPYILFELFSNISGIIEYGFDMTGSDVLSIISAYIEILLSGVIVYIIAYLVLMLLFSICTKAPKEQKQVTE